MIQLTPRPQLLHQVTRRMQVRRHLPPHALAVAHVHRLIHHHNHFDGPVGRKPHQLLNDPPRLVGILLANAHERDIVRAATRGNREVHDFRQQPLHHRQSQSRGDLGQRPFLAVRPPRNACQPHRVCPLRHCCHVHNRRQPLGAVMTGGTRHRPHRLPRLPGVNEPLQHHLCVRRHLQILRATRHQVDRTAPQKTSDAQWFDPRQARQRRRQQHRRISPHHNRHWHSQRTSLVTQVILKTNIVNRPQQPTTRALVNRHCHPRHIPHSARRILRKHDSRRQARRGLPRARSHERQTSQLHIAAQAHHLLARPRAGHPRGESPPLGQLRNRPQLFPPALRNFPAQLRAQSLDQGCRRLFSQETVDPTRSSPQVRHHRQLASRDPLEHQHGATRLGPCSDPPGHRGDLVDRRHLGRDSHNLPAHGQPCQVLTQAVGSRHAESCRQGPQSALSGPSQEPPW